MIRAIYRTVGIMALSMFAAAAVLIAALLTSVAIVIAGCYLALWPPKPKSTSARAMGILLDRVKGSKS